MKHFDRRFAAWAGVWTVASLVGFGLVVAIIPNPVFSRQIPVEPFAIGVWLLSAPLMGLIAATYMAPPAAKVAPADSLTADLLPLSGEPQSTTLGTVAGLGAFLAIGCPVCNKIALLLLGTSGALSIFGPLQPVIGGVSLVLLVVTLVWRMRLWTQGATCRLPNTSPRV